MTKNLKKLIDVHCHVIESEWDFSSLDQLSTGQLIVMGCEVQDWTKVEEIYKTHSNKIIPSFGIHPWRVSVVQDEWESQLGRLLETYPQALVGEIGLDALARDPSTGIKWPIEPQIHIFKKQLLIAARYARPVSIHSVGVVGKMYQILRDFAKESQTSLPPSLMIHSFSGSSDSAKQLMRIPLLGTRIYFSFSKIINTRSPSWVERMMSIPLDRILIESDQHDLKQVDEGMEFMLNEIAHHRKILCDELVNVLERNVRSFLSIS